MKRNKVFFKYRFVLYSILLFTNVTFASVVEINICYGDCIDIGQEATGVENPCYYWKPEELFIGNDDITLPTQNVCPEKNATYFLTITSGNGDLIQEIEYNIIVNEINSISLSVSPGDQGVCNFPVNIIASEGFVSYSWSGGNSTTNSNQIEATSEGLYSVTATDGNGCTVTDEIELTDSNIGALAIKGLLEENEFYSIPIFGIEEVTFTDNGDENNFMLNTEHVTDYAELNIKLTEIGELQNIVTSLNDFLDDEFFDSFTPKKSYISKNQTFCANNPSFEDMKSYLNNQKVGIWAHVWENPDSPGIGELYIIGTSPTTETGLAKMNEAKDAYFEYVVLEEPDPEFFPTKDEEILYALQDLLTDFYIDDFTIENLNEFKQFNEINPLTECNPSTSLDLNAITPAGIPVSFGFGVSPVFRPLDKLPENFSPGTVINYFKEGVEFRGRWKPSEYKFTGYSTIKTPNYGQFENLTMVDGVVTFPSFQVVLGAESEFNEGYLGVVIRGGYSWDIEYGEYESHYPRGEGPVDPLIITDYLGMPIGSASNPIEYPANAIPQIYEHDLVYPKSVIINENLSPHSQMYKVLSTNGQAEAWVFSRLAPDAEIEYFIWNCDYKKWILVEDVEEVDVVIRDQMSFYYALFEVFKEQGHSSLDWVGLIPMLGDAADGLNGIWYLAEGDELEATISVASIGIGELAAVVRIGPAIRAVFIQTSEGLKRVKKLLVDVIRGNPGTPPDPTDIRNLVETIVRRSGNTPDHIIDDDRLLDLLNWMGEDADEFLKRYEAWELLGVLYTGPLSERLWDKDLISKVAELLADEEFMTKVGGELNLGRIIETNVLARCSSCITGNTQNANLYLRQIHEYLDDVQHFVKNYKGKPGFEVIFNNIVGLSGTGSNGIKTTFKGNQFVIRSLNDPNVNHEHIFGFEFEYIPPNDFSADIRINPDQGGTLKEFKSWTPYSLGQLLLNPNKNSGVINQHKAYLTDGNFEYKFDKRKLLRDCIDCAQTNEFLPDLVNNLTSTEVAENHIREKFLNMYQLDPQSIYDANPDYFLGFEGIDSYQDFLDILDSNDFNHEIFNFITVL